MSEANHKYTMITHNNPKSPISEAYRTLRTNIQFSSIDQALRVIMVSSSSPGEGKSTTSTNLAISYAQAENKVLLIDADLRKPSLHKIFFKSNLKGLSTVVSGQTYADSSIQATLVPNLSVLTSGPIPPNPSEMLGSKKMTSLLEELKRSYDIIIIDTPPALIVTDAQVVSTKCDGVVLVVRHGKVKRENAKKLKSLFDFVQARVLGVVLNDISKKQAENQNSHVSHYYGEDEKQIAK
jgi:capsular exopolysaccharide synthesis family protein